LGRVALTDRSEPKGIDVLVVVSDEADLTTLAVHARRLQGRVQQSRDGRSSEAR
jgi:hypothetical protein